MKFLETHFEEYINVSENLHPKINKIFAKFPKKIIDLQNIIFFGPCGCGKYTQMLKSIKHYSPSELKYEKKISITYNKQIFFFKISDIHYEIDMGLLGCNSKLLWHEIYLQIIDIISAKADKSGIIVCKNYHEIHNELLENFYSYMQKNTSCIDLKYILLTESVSFISDAIINCCEIINVPRPSKTMYNKCLKNKLPGNTKLNDITNIKGLHCLQTINPHKIICNKIIHTIIEIDDFKMLKFRDLLYDIFIYNLNVTECIWYILQQLSIQNKIVLTDMSPLLVKTFTFFQYYNNNYRPIYHLEQYMYYIIAVIHKY
jgi:hypothetical protein